MPDKTTFIDWGSIKDILTWIIMALGAGKIYGKISSNQESNIRRLSVLERKMTDDHGLPIIVSGVECAKVQASCRALIGLKLNNLTTTLNRYMSEATKKDEKRDEKIDKVLDSICKKIDALKEQANERNH